MELFIRHPEIQADALQRIKETLVLPGFHRLEKFPGRNPFDVLAAAVITEAAKPFRMLIHLQANQGVWRVLSIGLSFMESCRKDFIETLLVGVTVVSFTIYRRPVLSMHHFF